MKDDILNISSKILHLSRVISYFQTFPIDKMESKHNLTTELRSAVMGSFQPSSVCLNVLSPSLHPVMQYPKINQCLDFYCFCTMWKWPFCCQKLKDMVSRFQTFFFFVLNYFVIGSNTCIGECETNQGRECRFISSLTDWSLGKERWEGPTKCTNREDRNIFQTTTSTLQPSKYLTSIW